MDALKDFLKETATKHLPTLVRWAFTTAGKYVLPFMAGTLGIDQAQAGNWWTATAAIAAGAALAGACSAIDRWATRKKAAEAATVIAVEEAAKTEAKIDAKL